MKYAVRKGGFALLLTLIVVSVVLAIGLSLLNITLKQFTLSATARDSEVAFHAANSGLDCMQYYRNAEAEAYLLGSAVPATCGEVTDGPAQTSTTVGDAIVRHYVYEFDDAGTSDVCIETSMYLLDLRSSTTELNDYDISGEGLDDISCAPGVVCTTIFSRGYNRSCSDLDSIRTVQRELTAQF